MGMLAVICLALAVSDQGSKPSQPRLELAFSRGLVWVKAQGATLGQILAAWTRTGQTSFEGIEKAPDSGPLDVQLSGVSEREALDFLLRQAGGYTAVVRDSAGPVESMFARVLIVGARAPGASSTSPEPPPELEPVPAERILSPDGTPVPDDQQDAPPFRSMPPGFSPPPETPSVRDEQ